MPSDVLKSITILANQVELVLTAYFNGGPIIIASHDGVDTKTHTFGADPFFRKRDHNIVIANLLIRIPSPTTDPAPFLVVQFANMFSSSDQPANGVKWRIQLSDARTPSILHSDGGTLAFEQNANTILQIHR
jgi:hypothetical protein